MKNSLLHAIWLGTAMIAFGADSPKDGKSDSAKPVLDQAPGQDLTAYQKEFLNLPQERRDEYTKHMNEAFRLFGEKRVFETLDELTKAGKIFQDNPDQIGLYAACQVEFRAFDKALEAYRRADKLKPRDGNIRFNIGEVLFVTKKWKEADEIFEDILKQGGESAKIGKPLLRLIEFKSLLCKLKLGRKEEAQILSEKYDYFDDSPYYYYAKAAICYEKQDLVGAEEWLAMAGRIFKGGDVTAPWQDTMVEYGFIKSFYGGEVTLDGN